MESKMSFTTTMAAPQASGSSAASGLRWMLDATAKGLVGGAGAAPDATPAGEPRRPDPEGYRPRAVGRHVLDRRAPARAIKHDPEKWPPVFGKDHAQTKK